MPERWEDMDVVRDVEGDLLEIWVAVDAAPTESAAEERARRVYGPLHSDVPVVTDRGWLHVRAIDPDEPEESADAEEYGLDSIVAPCAPDAPRAREFWTVQAVDPSEVDEYRRDLTPRQEREQ